jgi:hypothetical protein
LFLLMCMRLKGWNWNKCKGELKVSQTAVIAVKRFCLAGHT